MTEIYSHEGAFELLMERTNETSLARKCVNVLQTRDRPLEVYNDDGSELIATWHFDDAAHYLANNPPGIIGGRVMFLKALNLVFNERHPINQKQVREKRVFFAYFPDGTEARIKTTRYDYRRAVRNRLTEKITWSDGVGAFYKAENDLFMCADRVVDQRGRIFFPHKSDDTPSWWKPVTKAKVAA